MQSPALAGGVSHHAESLSGSEASMLFHFLSPLLILLNKFHGVCPTWELEPSFLRKCVLECQEGLGTQARHLEKCSGNEQMIGDLAIAYRVQCYGESRSLPGSQQLRACLPGSNRAERPHGKSYKFGFKAQFCYFLLCDTEHITLS